MAEAVKAEGISASLTDWWGLNYGVLRPYTGPAAAGEAERVRMVGGDVDLFVGGCLYADARKQPSALPQLCTAPQRTALHQHAHTRCFPQLFPTIVSRVLSSFNCM